MAQDDTPEVRTSESVLGYAGVTVGPDGAAPEPASEVLPRALVAWALYADDLEQVAAACLDHAGHPDPVVRGNAVLGFGHLARRFKRLPREAEVRAAVAAGLADPEAYVRGQAHAAAGDLSHFLGWRVRPPAA